MTIAVHDGAKLIASADGDGSYPAQASDRYRKTATGRRPVAHLAVVVVAPSIEHAAARQSQAMIISIIEATDVR